MALDEAGVQLIAQGVAAYISDINKADASTAGFYKTLGESDKPAGAFQQVITGALRQVGAALVEFAAQGAKAIGGFVKDSIGLAGDFESGMLNFQAVAGKDVDTKGLEEFRDLFIDIGKRLPVSTAEVQQAATEMVKGGIDPATIAAGGLERNIQFAAAAMEGDLVKAAEISSKIMGGWAGVNATAAEKADFLTHATDMLTKAANASATDVEGLSLGIFNAQGIARTAGVSFDDLTTTLAALAPRFESSSVAGNSLKNMIARLQPTTKPATEAMKLLGLYTDETGSAFYNAQGDFIGFQQSAQLLQNALQGTTKEFQAEQLQLIFQSDAMGAAAALAEIGAQGYQNMADSLANANGVLDAAALKQQGFNVSLDNVKGSIEAMQITIGSFLLPVLGELLDNYINPGINNLTAFAETFLKMVPAIMASNDPLQTFLNALKIAAPGLMDAIVAVEDFKDAITPAVEEIMKLVDAFSQGGLSGLIDTIVTDLQSAAPEIAAALQSWADAFLDWIAPMIPPLLKQLGDLAGEAWDWIKQEAPGWGKQLLVWGEEFVNWIAPMIPPALAELGKLGESFLTWIGDQAAPLLKKFNDWATSFVAWIVPATVTFLAEWPKMFDQFLDWVGESAGPLLKQLGDWALAFIQWIAPMIPPFLVALGGVALAIGVWVVETAAVLSKKIVEVWLPAILGWIVKDAIPGLVKALDSFLQVFDGWIKDAQASLAQQMVSVGKALIDGLKEGISNAWSGIKSYLNSLADSLPDWFKDWWGIDSPSKVFAEIGQFAVQGMMQGFADTWPQLTDLVGSISKDLIDEMGDIGQQMNDAIADSFGATASIDRQIAKNFSDLAELPEGFYRNATENALKNAQDIASTYADPSIGAKFFALKSKQIFEFQELQKQINEETNADTKRRLQEQQSLILSAQEAEMAAFEQRNSRTSSPTMDIASQINDIMRTIAGINLTDDQIHIVDQLASLFSRLSAPQSSPYQTPGGSVAYNTSQQTTLNMPIYTNQSPGVLQDSMAMAGAALL